MFRLAMILGFCMFSATLHGQAFTSLYQNGIDPNGYANFLQKVNDFVLFVGKQAQGSDFELFSTNGTTTGTNSLRRKVEYPLGLLHNKDGKEYFLFSSYNTQTSQKVLNSTDGSLNNTFELGSITGNCIFTGNLLYYLNGDLKLCVTDGTPKKTKILSTKSTIDLHNTNKLGLHKSLGSKIILLGNAGGYGEELWAFDTATSELGLMHDLNPGKFSSFVSISNISFQKKMIFLAYVDSNLENYALCISDGSPNGLTILKNYAHNVILGSMLTINNKLLFFTKESSGIDVYISDGTGAGTKVLKSLNTNGSLNNLLIDGIEFKGSLFFSGISTNEGIELWRYDSATGNISLFKDIDSGEKSGQPHYFHIYDKKMYFTASQSAYGRELWVSDGTENGTKMIADLEPGPSSGSPDAFEYHNGHFGFYTHRRGLYDT